MAGSSMGCRDHLLPFFSWSPLLRQIPVITISYCLLFSSSWGFFMLFLVGWLVGWLLLFSMNYADPSGL